MHAKIPGMPFRYETGEEILAGDRIRYAGEAGTVEFVTDAANPHYAWYNEQFGGGCMLLTAQFGRVFTSHPGDDEDLDFVGRRGSSPTG